MNERIKFIKEIIKEKEEAYDFLKETDKESATYVLTDMKLYEEILKDLERLEMLEKENQELKEKIEISQKANKELSFTANAYAKAQKPYIEKIQKLEKAIEILKDKLKIELIENLNIPHEPLSKIKCCLQSEIWIKGITQQEYELLKEVLEC